MTKTSGTSGDPVGSKRVYFKRKNFDILKKMMQHDAPISAEIEQFIMDSLGKLGQFLIKKQMTIDELFKLLEIGPAYIKTLRQGDNSKSFLELHYDFAEGWKKW